jgi:hypothetical protein
MLCTKASAWSRVAAACASIYAVMSGSLIDHGVAN